MEEKLKQKADKFGFENEEFISQHLPELEKKFGTVSNKLSNDSKTLNNKNKFTFGSKAAEDSELNELLDMPPTPESLPSAIQSKVIRYDVKSSDNNKITGGINDFANKSKIKKNNKNPIPAQEFAPLKKIQSESSKTANKVLIPSSQSRYTNLSKASSNSKTESNFIESTQMNEIIATRTTTYNLPNVSKIS